VLRFTKGLKKLITNNILMAWLVSMKFISWLKFIEIKKREEGMKSKKQHKKIKM
jgi:hypothetical protein